MAGGEAGHGHGHFDSSEFDFGEGHDITSETTGAAYGFTHNQDRPDRFPANDVPGE